MVQKMTKNIKTLTEEAYQTVEDISIEQAKALLNDDAYVFVDVREADERRKLGVIPGTFTCPRGMLEFLIDPEFPAHNPVFAQDKTFIFYCAGGLRSLYAAKLAAEMGIGSVKNLAGGFVAWKEFSGEIQPEVG
ncbi:rhodanese-like domain-containing protein [Gammaproteobacteria bacterium AS21]